MEATTPGLFIRNIDVAAMRAVLVGEGDHRTAEIVAREAEIRAAQLAADTVALDGLIADELLFTGPDGELATKAQDLDAHGSGVVRFRMIEPEELRVRCVGNAVAVSALRVRLVVEVAGTLHRGTYRYTRVWAREATGQWRVVGGHVSEVRTSPPVPEEDVIQRGSSLAASVHDDPNLSGGCHRMGGL